MDLKAVIFDLDGVVVNTVPLHFKAWKKMFSEHGKNFSFQDYKEKVNGIPRIDGAKAILPQSSQQKLKKAASNKQNYFLEFLEKEGVEIYKSTLNLIKNLRKKSIKVAVISSSKNCLYILEKANIDNLFDVIITGNDIKRGFSPYFKLPQSKTGIFAYAQDLTCEDYRKIFFKISSI